jgi:3-polyprenyl-4-hydroxybenzoate decarboxylase
VKQRRIIVGISGATGVIYGIRMLERLRASHSVETHLVVSRWGHLTRAYETGISAGDLIALADHHHKFNDLTAPTPAAPSFAMAWLSLHVPSRHFPRSRIATAVHY